MRFRLRSCCLGVLRRALAHRHHLRDETHRGLPDGDSTARQGHYVSTQRAHALHVGIERPHAFEQVRLEGGGSRRRCFGMMTLAAKEPSLRELSRRVGYLGNVVARALGRCGSGYEDGFLRATALAFSARSFISSFIALTRSPHPLSPPFLPVLAGMLAASDSVDASGCSRGPPFSCSSRSAASSARKPASVPCSTLISLIRSVSCSERLAICSRPASRSSLARCS
mmetsp:Transcript_32533/g.64827  ORF Transcript_32533/g.64827 Transcript_32533/m.64827 type:complete len:226 (+) Transcript_32533:88-765(+)